jgi:HK97 family phage major capsid protein
MLVTELKGLISQEFEKGFRDALGKTFKDTDAYKELMEKKPNKMLGISGNDDNDSFNKNKAGFNKSYNQIFGNEKDATLSDGGFSSLDDYILAVKNMSISPDVRLRDMSEGVGSEGGFLLPAEFEKRVLDANLEDEIVRPRAMVYGLRKGRGNSLTIPATADTDHSSFEVAGITSYWGEEAGTKTKTQPTLRQVEMKINELYAYSETSDILLEDSFIPIGDLIGKLFHQNLKWRFDNAFLNGTGGGQPKGILQSNACGEQSAESGQDASTIAYENLCGMMGKLMPGSFKNSVWLAEISTIPQLLQLSLKVGTAGVYFPVLTGAEGKFNMLYRPVIFTEHLPALGSAGCLLLADFSQYLIVLKEGLRLETSRDFKFRQNQTVFRMVARLDGQTATDSSLTLKSGTVVYPFVKLGAVE